MMASSCLARARLPLRLSACYTKRFMSSCGTVESQLETLGITLPETSTTSLGNYVSAVQSGRMLYISGHLPRRDDGSLVIGKVGTDITEEEGYEAARIAAINALSTIKNQIGSLDNVYRVVHVNGYVNSASDFENHPEVINGASDLIVKAFGESIGQHVRSAVGTASLPRASAVEIDLVIETKKSFKRTSISDDEPISDNEQQISNKVECHLIDKFSSLENATKYARSFHDTPDGEKSRGWMGREKQMLTNMIKLLDDDDKSDSEKREFLCGLLNFRLDFHQMNDEFGHSAAVAAHQTLVELKDEQFSALFNRFYKVQESLVYSKKKKNYERRSV